MTGRQRLMAWFESRGWKPFPFQKEAWKRYRAGQSGIIHAPTGIGKTLAAWGGPLIEGMENRRSSSGVEPIQVLWITPLRALAADTLQSLQAPVTALDLPWEIAMRTGDTSASQRAKIRKKLPTVLVTTPESLSLFLSYADMREKMSTLRSVIIDEWHELLGSKRGVQTELCLARLRAWQPNLRTWGLSATIGNLGQARDVLLGNRSPDGVTVTGNELKKIEVETLIPASMDRFPWGGHLGTQMVKSVVEKIDAARTTLFFTNTRSQTEIWYQAILSARPDWKNELAMHHGSLERSIREEVEARLAEGTVKCVVSTSSLDLGVDFSPVDQVMQVGSPKGIARLIQRAGRSGHQPGQTSRIFGVPTNAFELVEFAATRAAVKARHIEERVPIELALDVLVQHLVTIAIGGGFFPDDMRQEVASSHAFRRLADQEWEWALQFITTGGKTLEAYPEYQKVRVGENGLYFMEDKRLIHLHRMNIGTITGETQVSVQMQNGKKLGTVEEGFISRIRKGQQFLFAGRRLELVRLKDLVATVCLPKSGRSQNVATWTGTKMPLSTELADAVAAKMREPSSRDPEMQAAAEILAIQRRWSAIPEPGQLLIETVETRLGYHVFLYPFAGRLVHEGLATLIASRLGHQSPLSVHLAFNDYGFELTAAVPFAPDPDHWSELFQTETLLADLMECMNLTELARRQFREVARVAGLILGNYPGQQKSMRSVQASSGLLFDVFQKYDRDNLLIAQAQREILERQLEMTRLRSTLEKMQSMEIVQRATGHLTPLAFPLWAEQVTTREVSTESAADQLARMIEELESAAG